MHNSTHIEQRDPRALKRKRHPLHRDHVPSPDKETPEWKAFSDTVQADGKIPGLVRITKEGFVVDGWWSVEAACDWQFEHVPCTVVEDGDVALVIVESLTARKQMTRGAAVYLALGLLPEYARACESRRIRNLAAKRTTNESNLEEKCCKPGLQQDSTRALAERFGCSHTTVFLASEVRKYLHDLPTFSEWMKEMEEKKPASARTPAREHQALQAALRAEFEAQLFNGETAIKAVLPAIAGRFSTARKPRDEEQLELFQSDLSAVCRRVLKMEDVDDAHAAVLRVLSGITEESELNRLQTFAEELGTAAKKRANELAQKSVA